MDDLVVVEFVRTIGMAATTNKTLAAEMAEVDLDRTPGIRFTTTTVEVDSTMAAIATRMEATSPDSTTSTKMHSIK